jgi:hypothetical protein
VFGGSALHTSGVALHTLARDISTNRLVVIGTGGVSPADIGPARTPNLWRLLREGSAAALNVTAVHVNTCPIDGWLTLSAGNQADRPMMAPGFPPASRSRR